MIRDLFRLPLLLACALGGAFASLSQAQDLLITGVIDGPLSGGVPKAVELYAVNNIADLSIYGIGSANNGGGSDGQEFTFPAEGAVAGAFIYVASEDPGFISFFGFAPDYTAGAANVNGDDAIELFANGVVIDVFGEIDVDGSGQPWEHTDGWAYRSDNTGPDGNSFILANWSFSSPNSLDGETTNATAVTPFPIGTYGGGSPGDNAPLVVSSVPSSGAGSVAIDSAITINFSEAVIVSDSWYEIICSNSGVVTATVAGGPQSFTLTPTVNLDNNESCTVTVFAAQVSDVDADDPPDNMAADFVLTFSTAGIPLADSIIVNEIIQNPAAVGDNAGEWFELFNATDNAIDINGWTVQDNGSNSFIIDNSGGLLVPAGGFVVLGNNDDSASNGGVQIDYRYAGTSLSNGADEIVLLDQDLVEIDRVEWDGGPSFPDPTGASMALIDPSLDNNIGTNWCESAAAFGSGDAGTPGRTNDCGFQPIINEIDYDQPGSDSAEFVEIRNNGAEAGDLSGFQLQLVNGNSGAAYASIALPSVTLESGDYFVVCSDITAVSNCDLAGFSSIQNGAPDAVALVDVDSNLVDVVSYEGDVLGFVEGSGAGLTDSGASGQDFKGIGRFPDGFDSNQNNVDFLNSCVSPGAANTSIDQSCSAGGPALEIYAIQGAGDTSPFVGQSLSSPDNIVTAVGPEGFFIQTPDSRSDNDSNTSDGIYVFTAGAPSVLVGDQVDVSGTVVEFFGFTQFGDASVSVDSSGNTLPLAITFDGNTPSPDPLGPSCAIEYECYEGMLVQIDAGTVTGSNQSFGSDPIAEIYITAEAERTFREPGIEFPETGPLVWDGNPEVFELDPDRLGLSNSLIPAGSNFSATGVIGFEFGGYELWPTELTVLPVTLPIAVRDRAEGELTVGSLNLFRLFDTAGNESLPADELMVRLEKFSAYVREVLKSPDVLAVQEVENLAVLQQLADEISGDDSSIVYTAYLEEGNDVGGIDVGFLVRESVLVDTITQFGKDQLLSVDNSLLHDRPPLLLEGRAIGPGGEFPIRVLAVHNRSLNNIESSRTQTKRLEQAQAIAEFVNQIQADNERANLVVTGDFNGFEFDDGYVHVLEEIAMTTPPLINQVDVIDPDQRYSFVFRGNAQALDHALTSEELDDLVRGLEYGRGNADGAVIAIDDPLTPVRASDHDGLVLFIAKDSDGDTIPDEADHCPATNIPETAPTRGIRRYRWALIDEDATFDTNVRRPRFGFNLKQTAGCSCEQIIDELRLSPRSANRHRKFGCSTGLMTYWKFAVRYR